MYSETDLERLHQILLFRQLGFSLEAIQQLLDAPAGERRSALVAQRKLLEQQVRKTEAVVRAVDAALDALERTNEMDTNKMFDGFDQFDHAQYEDEARERWGNTEAYKESARRTKGYSKDDWAKLKGEVEEIGKAFAKLLLDGRQPTDVEAMNTAERARLHIDRWFYPCPHRMHVALGEMYVSDPRFLQHYERQATELAVFVRDAIAANARRAEG